MELHEALASIREIRLHAQGAGRFHGYKALPIAGSGVIAIVAAVAQPLIVSEPEARVGAYLLLWLGAALFGGLAAATGVWVDRRAAGPSAGADLTRLAVGQFLPCLAAGALVTVTVARHAPQIAWILPGIWQVLFSLGVFASCRLLPAPIALVGVFYLLTGAANLAGGALFEPFSPWAMGFPFAAGQLAIAGVLYWHLERPDAE